MRSLELSVSCLRNYMAPQWCKEARDRRAAPEVQQIVQ